MNYSNLLLTTTQMHEKYQQLHHENYVYPYFYKITASNKLLFFVGPHHTYDPRDPQINKIKQYWDDFLKATEKKSCITLTEGGKRIVARSEDEAIRNDAEAGLVTYLAAQESIDTISPEPNWNDEINELLREFTKEEIALHDFVRVIAQWNRLQTKPDFDTYLEKFSKKYFERLQWSDFDFSTENLINLFKETYKLPFDKDKYEVFHALSSPQKSNVAAASSRIRDIFILRTIIDLWAQSKNIFVVYGSGHALTLEPALKKLLQ